MNEREEEVKADILTLRSLAKLDADMLGHAIAEMGLSMGLIAQKNQAAILHGLYEGVVELAVRLGNSWDQALTLTRSTAGEGSEDFDTQVAYDKLLRDTRHLYDA